MRCYTRLLFTFQFVEVLAADSSRELYEEALALEEIASQGQMGAVPLQGPQGR